MDPLLYFLCFFVAKKSFSLQWVLHTSPTTRYKCIWSVKCKASISDKPRLTKGDIFLQLHSTIPQSHEGDAKEEAKSATNLSNQRGGRVEQLLLLNQGVPGGRLL